MALPRPEYCGWRWVSTDGTIWLDSGSQPAGYLIVPSEFAQTDSDLLTVDAGVVRLKTSAELRSELVSEKLAACYAYEQSLISAGFSHSGITFSLSTADMILLTNISILADTLTYPLEVESADGLQSLILANADDARALYSSAVNHVLTTRATRTQKTVALRTALADPDPDSGLSAAELIQTSW